MNASSQDSQWIPLDEVPLHVPRSASGKRKHVSWVYRIASTGAYGVVLRTVSFGRQRCTTLAWLAEFGEKCEAARREAKKPAAPARQRRIKARRAAAEREAATDSKLARHGLA